MKTALEWKNLYAKPDFQEKYHYGGHDLGARCGEEETVFKLWSPFAEKAVLRLYREGSGGEAFREIPMEREGKGVWSLRVREGLHGIYYDYELAIEGESVHTADPYAKACGINGARSMAVNLKRTDPEGWEEDRAPEKTVENIIYELHVKEFSWDEAGGFPEQYRGKYKAFLCDGTSLNHDKAHPTGCAYLRELGITHVQLMPVYDFGSVDEAGAREGFNWGYDPVNYNVPEGSYSTDAAHGEVRIREMKEMVQALHKNGFRVVMDVVYNHTYHRDSWLQRTVPWYYYRVRPDGTLSDGSCCGNDVASEEFMCADYILDSVLYWAEEYHIDGFRFDLMGLLDVELMNRIRDRLDERYGRGEKILYGEPWGAEKTAIAGGKKRALKENLSLLDEQIGIFCDNTRNAVKGSVFQEDRTGFVNGAQGLEEDVLNSVRAWQQSGVLDVKAPSQVVTYISAHDNQTLWDKIESTVGDSKLYRRINKMAAAVYMTCQGNLFMLSGEEFGRTKGGLGNSYNASIELNRLDWKQAWREEELVRYYRGLIALRKQLPAFYDKSAGAGKRICGTWSKPQAAGFLADNRDGEKEARSGNGGCWDKLCVIYNARQEKLKKTLPAGEWQILVNGENSFLWKEEKMLSGTAVAGPLSVLVLGRRDGTMQKGNGENEMDIRKT